MHTLHQCDNCKKLFNGYGVEYVETMEYGDIYCSIECTIQAGVTDDEDVAYTDDEGTDETLEPCLQAKIKLINGDTYYLYTNDYSFDVDYIGATDGQQYYDIVIPRKSETGTFVEVDGILYQIRI